MVKSHRILILAAGKGSRWNDHEGSPKHLVSIEGERLLDRTIRQFRKYTNNIIIVGVDERYKVEGLELFIPRPPARFIYPKEYKVRQWKEMDKFASSMHLWNEGRTTLVFGDVYFTDEAVETIMTCQKTWTIFCRTGSSSITGKDCKEIFAFSFEKEHQDELTRAIEGLIDVVTTSGGWSLFRTLTRGKHEAVDHEVLFDNDRYVEIDDWTEDFDYPRDLINWKDKRQASL